MTDDDLDDFTRAFTQLRTVFALRADALELQQIQALYFRVLQRHPIAVVLAGAARWIDCGTRFPKPSEWARAIPRAAASAPPVPALGYDAAADHRRAVELGYQDEPCTCLACKAAGVDHRFLRYVPELDTDDHDDRVMLDGKATARGHWAHGLELAAWYAAHDAYMALRAAYPVKGMRGLEPRARRLESFAMGLIERQARAVALLEAHPPAELVEEHT